jgi:cell division initiation protein
MPYSPVELRHVRLGRSLFGYKRDATERLLDEVAASFEDVWRERGELTDEVDELTKQLEDIRGREHLLAATLVAAEKSAADSRDAAKRQAELILAEAHQEARSIMRGAQGQRERLFAEARRVETLLRGALGIVEESQKPLDLPEAPDEAPHEPVESSGVAHEPDPYLEEVFEGEQEGEEEAAPALAEAHPDPWQNREDTAEFPSLMNIRSEVDPEQL